MHRMRGISGSERHLLTLLPALAKGGTDVVFVGLDDPASDPSAFYELVRVDAVRLPCPRDVDPVLAARLTRELRRLRPDVVHTHLVHADVYGAFASVGAPWAVVSTKHNDDKFRKGPFRVVERTVTARAQRVIAITHALARFSERAGVPGSKIDVVHYGLDELPEAWGAGEPPPSNGRLLVSVARLVEQKGVDVALRALARVRAAHPDVRLAVLGEGPERPRLEALARELGVADALLLPGRVGDAGAWLRRAHLVVHSARWEGFGLVLLEAMLAAKAIVATRVSAVPEIVVDGETGTLVSAEDFEAFARAIDAFLRDDARREQFGRAGRERARREFSVERMTTATLEVYQRALALR